VELGGRRIGAGFIVATSAQLAPDTSEKVLLMS